MEPLHPVEIRILGALIEKDITTPEYYPLTVNALMNACNQKSSREPVVSYEEDTVLQGLASLREKGLALKISGAGHRVEKFGHSLGERLNLGRREFAILCVLMLRGPQTVGELRGRTERMHDFVDLEEVERVLESLSSREPEPLVTRMPRGRWAQLLGGMPDAEVEPQSTPLSAVSAAYSTPMPADAQLEQRISQLEQEVESLKEQFAAFRKQFE